MLRDLTILITCGFLLYGCAGARGVSDPATLGESGGSQFEISWTPSAALDVAKHHIYACKTAVGCPASGQEPLVTVAMPKTQTTITSPFEVGEPFVLVVTAEDHAGNESQPSQLLDLN